MKKRYICKFPKDRKREKVYRTRAKPVEREPIGTRSQVRATAPKALERPEMIRERPEDDDSSSSGSEDEDDKTDAAPSGVLSDADVLTAVSMLSIAKDAESEISLEDGDCNTCGVTTARDD